MDQWNGVSFMSLFSPAPPTIVIETDASGSWGAGAVWADRWFLTGLDERWREQYGESTVSPVQV